MLKAISEALGRVRRPRRRRTDDRHGSGVGEAVGGAAGHPQEPAGLGLDPPVVELGLQLARDHIEGLVDLGVPVQDRPRFPGSKGELTGAEQAAGVVGEGLERQDGVVAAGLASGEHIGCGPNMDQARPAPGGSGAPLGGPWLAR